MRSVSLRRRSRQVVLLLVFASALTGGLMAEEGAVQSALFEDLRVQSWIGASFQGTESRTVDVYERTRTASAQGEWAFRPWVSVYLRIPYSEMVHTDRARSAYWDHVRGGLKLQVGNSSVGALGGVFGDVARGHNHAGDVPANYGYLEPYAGLYLRNDRLFLQSAVRWNTQTTSRFIEEPGENFRRSWLGDLSLGVRFRPVTLLVDARYHEVYDPVDVREKYVEGGPGVDLELGHGMHVTLAAVFSTRREAKGRGAIIGFRKFID